MYDYDPSSLHYSPKLIANTDIFDISACHICINKGSHLMDIQLSFHVKSTASITQGWHTICSYEGLAYEYPPSNNKVCCVYNSSPEAVYRDLQVNGDSASIYLWPEDTKITSIIFHSMIPNTYVYDT